MQDDISRMTDNAEHLQQVVESLNEELQKAKSKAKENVMRELKKKELDFKKQKNQLEQQLAAER